MWNEKAILGTPLKADISGINEGEAAVKEILAPLQEAGHYTADDDAPNGWTAVGRIGQSGGSSYVFVDVTLWFAGEARGFQVPIIGREVS